MASKTVIFNIDCSASVSATFNLRGAPYNLSFYPKHLIVRQLCYYSANGDVGIFVIGTNLPNVEYIGAVYNSIQAAPTTPQTHVRLPDLTQSITFTVSAWDTVVFTNPPTGQLTMVLELTE